MDTPCLDPRLGRTELTFAEPLVLARMSVLVLGGALALAGALFSVLMVLEPPRHASDALGFGVFAGLMLLGGLGLSLLSLRSRSSKPTWHLCEHGAVRMTTSGPGVTLWWHDIAELVVVEIRNSGYVVGYLLKIGGRRVRVPNQLVAQSAYRLWQAARAGGTV